MAADNFLWFPDPAKGGLLAAANAKASQPEGETTDKWFKDMKALEVSNVSFGLGQAQTAGSSSTGAGAGKAKFEEFSLDKGVDLASVPLYLACTAGAHFPSVMLACRKAGGENLVYLQYIFRMVFVTSISWQGGGGEEAPRESIKFKFGAMGIQYIQQSADGTEGTNKMIGYWNTTTNRPDLVVPGLDKVPELHQGLQV